jgi:hypothetical protein
MAWLNREMPNANFIAFGWRLLKFFPISAFISELVWATLRCATGNEHKGRGEDAYYYRKVRVHTRLNSQNIRAECSVRPNLFANDGRSVHQMPLKRFANCWPLTKAINRLPLIVPNGHTDPIERCPLLGPKRKTSAQREYFAF